jgi:hypothetical protein
MTVPLMRHSLIVSIIIIAIAPTILFADNCGGLIDCYGTQIAAAAVIGAIAVGIAVVWAWPVLLEMLAAEGGSAAIGSQEMLLTRHFILRAAEELAAEAEEGVELEKMAGAGVKRAIDDLPRLISQYGGEAADWAKMTTRSAEISPGRSIQLHFYENEATGEIVEMKIKPGQLRSTGTDAALQKLWSAIRRWFS